MYTNSHIRFTLDHFWAYSHPTRPFYTHSNSILLNKFVARSFTVFWKKNLILKIKEFKKVSTSTYSDRFGNTLALLYKSIVSTVLVWGIYRAEKIMSPNSSRANLERLGQSGNPVFFFWPSDLQLWLWYINTNWHIYQVRKLKFKFIYLFYFFQIGEVAG